MTRSIGPNPPCSTTVGGTGFPRSSITIEALAIMPSERSASNDAMWADRCPGNITSSW